MHEGSLMRFFGESDLPPPGVVTRCNLLASKGLPELLDVRLMAMSPQAFTLAGFERVAGVEYAQSWLVSDAT